MSQKDKLLEEIKKINPKRVLLQLPEGLLVKSKDISDLLSEEKIENFISVEPCYGACDIRDCEAKRLGCDLLVHLGHSDFGLKTDVPVLYFEWKMEYDPTSALKKSFSKLDGFKKIGLVSTVNYIDSLEKAKKCLEENGKECVVEKTLSYPGQILGCDVSAGLEALKKSDCLVFIGSGEFHALGVALKSSNPVFSLTEENNGLIEVNVDRFIRQKEAAKAIARECNKFGILVSTKPGQINTETAMGIKKKLKSEGKRAWIFTMDLITKDKLLGLGIDCFVNCACPRIAIENRTLFGNPIVNPDEV